MSLVQDLNRELSGFPDKLLSLILVVAAFVLLAVAASGPPTAKALVAAWVLAP